jgi:photosystem II stability/assembly factor-like uncharacterized protein
MRAASAILLVLASAAAATPPANYSDAPLHAVQFIDRQEGWAAGDEGVIWHTIDGGGTWERQSSGARASLRSIYFLTPYTGWIAGRQELPHGAGSSGVILFTRDGGLHWKRSPESALSGLNLIRFIDEQTGFLAGDGSDRFPSGLFKTTDAGRTWQPVSGQRISTWTDAGFSDAETGILAGPSGQVAAFRQGQIEAGDRTRLAPRAPSSVNNLGRRGIALGLSGFLIENQDSQRWNFIRPDLLDGCGGDFEFRAVCAIDQHIWAAGRPGSVLWHSADRGRHWQAVRTGQPLPLNGIWFTDERNGWAVGEFASILNTRDGGKTWSVQQRGGQRAALLLAQARSADMPFDIVAALSGEEGYLTVGVGVTIPQDSASFTEGCRLSAAVRRAGGAGGEALGQFPLAGYQLECRTRELLESWDKQNANAARELLLRQLVLALRIWRPDVVITDNPRSITSSAAAALVAEIMREAFVRAADPKAFPQQIETVGLEPWQATKLYGGWDNRSTAHLLIDVQVPGSRSGMTPRELAAPAYELLTDCSGVFLPVRAFSVLANRLDEMAARRGLMDGIPLAPAGTARRALPAAEPVDEKLARDQSSARHFEAVATTQTGTLADPAKILAELPPVLARLPDEQAAASGFQIAGYYARTGQWQFAHELYRMMVERYPAQPASIEAYRWLIRHGTSGEARRRIELGQFKLHTQLAFTGDARQTTQVKSAFAEAEAATVNGAVSQVRADDVTPLDRRKEAKQLCQESLDLGKKFAAFGPTFADDPSVGFCLQSARRKLGDLEAAREWYAYYRRTHATGPWSELAAEELWLLDRRGTAVRPSTSCPATNARPYLDGKLDEECWQTTRPLAFKNAAGDTLKTHPTEAWLAHDSEYLYLALRCRQPEKDYEAPVKARERDANLRGHDRISLLLDVDRDYSTYFELQVDQRGAVAENCWGDPSWNPRWFVAFQSRPGSWQVEAAIPLAELTGEPVKPGQAWACNLVRTIPGKGVQAFSLPADVCPRPEGMGILLFTEDLDLSKKGTAPQSAR